MRGPQALRPRLTTGLPFSQRSRKKRRVRYFEDDRQLRSCQGLQRRISKSCLLPSFLNASCEEPLGHIDRPSRAMPKSKAAWVNIIARCCRGCLKRSSEQAQRNLRSRKIGRRSTFSLSYSDQIALLTSTWLLLRHPLDPRCEELNSN
jgi:hypothetical protein